MLTRKLFASDVVSGGMFPQNAEQILNCSKAKEEAKEKAKAKAKISLGVVERGGAKVPRLRPRLGAPRVGLLPQRLCREARVVGAQGGTTTLAQEMEPPGRQQGGLGLQIPGKKFRQGHRKSNPLIIFSGSCQIW